MLFEPIPTLLKRVRGELADAFAPGSEVRVSRAPGSLDVMGGVAESTGANVLRMPLDCAAAVCTQPRGDREVQIFSFNLLDEHKPFTLRIPLDALNLGIEKIRADFSKPGRAWAIDALSGLAAFHWHQKIDLSGPDFKGFNIATLSTIPDGAGLGMAAAIGAASAINVGDSLSVRAQFVPPALAMAVELSRIHLCDCPDGQTQYFASMMGEAGTLIRSAPPAIFRLKIPPGMKFVAIDSGTRGGQRENQLLRSATEMARRMILEKMRDFGRAAGRELQGDPMEGLLANLDPDDYKKFFRQFLPETIKGGEYLLRFGTGEWNFAIVPDTFYNVRSAADHHVLEAMRVRNFIKHFEEALSMDPADPARGLVLDKAGHLMYASHHSYTNDAGLCSVECDLIVTLVRRRERSGLYGARITAGGCGGSVAVLCEDNDKADTAIREIAAEYQKQSGKTPHIFDGTSPGAWETGTQTLTI